VFLDGINIPPLTIPHMKGRKYLRGSHRTFERKNVEVTGGWRKMYKEELHEFVLTTKCFEIKYNRNGRTCIMHGRQNNCKENFSQRSRTEDANSNNCV
jgi:hypothetical protein